MTDTTTEPATTRPGATDYELVWLNPADLTAHPRNVRTDLGDLSELQESIAANGVIEPLTVVPIHDTDGDGYRIVAGHRRAAAAAAAEVPLVPCVARADLVENGQDDPEALARHIGAMLSENVLREGLTAAEQARGVQQMLDLGMNVAAVTRTTGFARKHVIKAVAANRVTHPEATDLTLDQLAAVSEFHDDEEATAALIEAAQESPGEFAHELSRQRGERKAAQELAQARAELVEQGWRLIEEEEDRPRQYGDGARYLSGLSISPDDRTELTPDAHAACPGRAAYVDVVPWSGEIRTTEVCTDWAANGHGERYGGGNPLASSAPTRREDMSEEEAEAAREERRMTIANNKAMDAANATRRQWVKTYLAGRRAPKTVLRFCVETFAADRGGVAGWFSVGGNTSEADDAVRALGLTQPSSWTKVAPSLTSGESVADDRLPMQLLAHIAAGYEATIGRSSWRDGNASHARWLRFLETHGYTLSDVEHHLIGVVDAAQEKRAQRTATVAQADDEPADEPEDDEPEPED